MPKPKKSNNVKIIKNPKFKEDETFINHNEVKFESSGSTQQFPQDPDDLFRNQIQLMNEFVESIRAKQLEKLFKLSEQKIIEVDGEKYQRKKGLSASQWKELSMLDMQVGKEEDMGKRIDMLIQLRKKCGLYYFGIPEQVTDEHYEELEETYDSCMLRSYSGLNSDVNINEMLEQFKKRYDNSLITKI